MPQKQLLIRRGRTTEMDILGEITITLKSDRAGH